VIWKRERWAEKKNVPWNVIVLVRVTVNSEGASRGMEEVWEEVGYRYLQEW